MTDTIIPLNPHEVLCDICDQDWSDSAQSGGFLLLSKGVGPCCEARLRDSIAKYKEEWSIKGECPANMSFADWIRNVVRKDQPNEIRITTL